MFTCKVLTSRACELAGVDDMELDLRKRDPECVEVCQNFVAALRRVDRIIPFERSWVPTGYRLLGFVTSLDRGHAGTEVPHMSWQRRRKESQTQDIDVLWCSREVKYAREMSPVIRPSQLS